MTSKRKPSVQVTALFVGALWAGSALSAEAAADGNLWFTELGETGSAESPPRA